MILRNLFSAKQVGTLYHYTSISNLMYILDEGILKGGDARRMFHPMDRHFSPSRYTFLSTTRDKNFHRTYRGGISLHCRLALDGDRISERYKVLPYDYFWDDQDPDEAYASDPRRITPVGLTQPYRLGPRPEFYESEEVVLVPRTSDGGIPVFKYLLGVDILQRDGSDYMSKHQRGEVKKILSERNIPFKAIT